MKHIRSVILSLVFLTTIACSNSGLRIEGNLENLPDGKMYLSLIDSNFQRIIVDTAIIRDGHFVFEGKLDLPVAECVILSDGEYCEFPIFAGNDNVTITGDLEDLDNVQVSGSKYFDIIRNFGKNIPEQEHMEQLQREFYAVSGNVDRQMAIREEMEMILEEQLAYVRLTINNNISNPVGPFLLSNYMQFFDFDEVEELVNSFSETMSDYKYVRTMQRVVEKTREEIEMSKFVEIGCKAPDFELPDIDGNLVKLSDYKGKVVLIEFWHSQYPQCRTNNENLNETYSKFSTKNFEIISVSLDTEIDDWKTVVEEDNLMGITLIDTANIIGDKYCIRRVPFSYLIDEKGIIISKDADQSKAFSDVERLLK